MNHTLNGNETLYLYDVRSRIEIGYMEDKSEPDGHVSRSGDRVILEGRNFLTLR